jgi:hypothetical protein
LCGSAAVKAANLQLVRINSVTALRAAEHPSQASQPICCDFWFDSSQATLPPGSAPRPLKLVGSVDGVNRAVDWRLVEKSYEPALSAYQKAGYRERLILGRTMDPESPANWLSEALKTN